MYAILTTGQNIVEDRLWNLTVYHKNKGITEFANAVTARVFVDPVPKENIVRIRARQLVSLVLNVISQMISLNRIVHQRPTPYAVIVLRILTCRSVILLQECVIATLGMK